MFGQGNPASHHQKSCQKSGHFGRKSLEICQALLPGLREERSDLARSKNEAALGFKIGYPLQSSGQKSLFYGKIMGKYIIGKSHVTAGFNGKIIEVNGGSSMAMVDSRRVVWFARNDEVSQ